MVNSDKLSKYEKEYFAKMLAAHYSKAPVIIIDEYDIPIQEGYSKDFYEEIIGFMRNFFSGAFKDNKYLSYGFLTGIFRIAQESILKFGIAFSGKKVSVKTK